MDDEVQSSVIFMRMLLKLDALQNDFFLYRLLARKGHRDEGCLLATSFQLVSLVLILWTHLDRFAKMRPDFEWLVGWSPRAQREPCLPPY